MPRLLNSLFLAFFLAATSWAQTTLTLNGPATVTQGTTSIPVSINLAGASGFNVTALQWTVGPPGTSITAPTPSPTATIAGKGAYCNVANSTCILLGLSSTNVVTNNPLVDGVIANITITIPANATGTLRFGLVGLLATNTSGAAVAISDGPDYSVTITGSTPTFSKCDVNQDGQINGIDVLTVVNAAMGKAACPATLTAGCSYGTAIVVHLAAAPAPTNVPCSL